MRPITRGVPRDLVEATACLELARIRADAADEGAETRRTVAMQRCVDFLGWPRAQPDHLVPLCMYPGDEDGLDEFECGDFGKLPEDTDDSEPLPF